MDVCLLTQREVARLENHRIIPSHKDHEHISIEAAIAGLRADELRAIDLERFSVAEQYSNGRVWKSRPSGGYNVRQLVFAEAQYEVEASCPR